MDTETLVALVYETEPCSRCEGTGKFSFNPFHGRSCFRCRGTGAQLSSAGEQARTAYRAAMDAECSVTYAALRRGDRVWGERRNGRLGWVEVLSVEDTDTPGTLSVATSGYPLYGRDTTRVWLHEAPIINRIRREIADRFAGATLD